MGMPIWEDTNMGRYQYGKITIWEDANMGRCQYGKMPIWEDANMGRYQYGEIPIWEDIKCSLTRSMRKNDSPLTMKLPKLLALLLKNM